MGPQSLQESGRSPGGHEPGPRRVSGMAGGRGAGHRARLGVAFGAGLGGRRFLLPAPESLRRVS